VLAALAFVALLSPPGARAQVTWPRLIFALKASGFVNPVHIAGPRDGSGRLFVVERRGVIRIVKGQTVLPRPFLDIRDRVLSVGGEQGLLSIAFPPGFATRRQVYVDYTSPGGGAAGHTVVSRFTLLTDGTADPASEEVLLTVDQPFANHNGGQLAFGPDGYLYIGMGDGGGDPGNRPQSLATRLGKILRIDGRRSAPGRLVIPAGNPFVGRAGDDAIWAYGLRNPWRFSFDRVTADLYIADVGQHSWEEVDFQLGGSPGGQNYGWNRMEGNHTYPPGSPPPPFPTIRPVTEYPHGVNDAYGCSVTGGFVSRSTLFPAMRGIYFFADFCTGKVFGLRRVSTSWSAAQLADTPFLISTFGEDGGGNLYVADYATGRIFLIMGQ
jgi:glucose/arabinose dehydrogenase